MNAVRQILPDPPPAGAPVRATPRQRLGLVLMAAGLASILWGVFHVLAAIGPYEQRDFAHRKTDYEVRSTVHETFPGGFARAMGGLGLLLLGGRLRRPPRT